ncbi:MAG: periplasmic heavy metal sensor [Aliidongia sp.]
MNRKTWMIGALCAALLPLAAVAQQGDAPGGMPMHFHGGMHGGGASALLQGVTLTSTQQTQIASIRQTNWAAAKPIMQQLRATETQIRDLLLAAGSVNTAQLTSLQQTASSLHQQLDAQRLNTMLQIRAVLTSTQIAQAASTHQQMQALHQQMHSLMQSGAESSTAQ